MAKFLAGQTLKLKSKMDSSEIFYILLLIFIVGIQVFRIFRKRSLKGSLSHQKYFSLNSDQEILASSTGMIIRASCLFQLLNESQKSQFRKRVLAFIRNKEFIPSGVLEEVTDEMKIIVSSLITQLTFGHPEENLEMFTKIILYPDEFQYGQSDQYLDGEVNLSGCIILSWKNLVEGIEDKADGRNLALHEAAHALRLSAAFHMSDQSEKMIALFHEFDELAGKEMQNYEVGRQNFFREYGAENYNEFFAVATECFFEVPEKFYEYNPLLYNKLKQIMRLDLMQMNPVLQDV
jgi:MtfA peptidase